MARFIEVHERDGRSVEDIAELHGTERQACLMYGVTFLRHWLSEESGRIFCLVDAPDMDSVRAASPAVAAREITELFPPMDS